MRTVPLVLSLFTLCVAVRPARADSLDDLRTQVRLQVTRAVVQKVIAKLALDDATAKRFTEVADRYAVRLDAARQKLRHDFGALKEKVDANADPSALDAASTVVIEDQQEVNRITEERGRATRKVLTARQFAELVLFYPQINRMLADEIESARAPR
jgi:hypothetical protein